MATSLKSHTTISYARLGRSMLEPQDTRTKMFKKLHKQDNGYQVTRYLYATCQNPLPGALQSSLSSEKWDVESNWMGYVAVIATELQEIERLGRRDIFIA